MLTAALATFVSRRGRSARLVSGADPAASRLDCFAAGATLVEKKRWDGFRFHPQPAGEQAMRLAMISAVILVGGLAIGSAAEFKPPVRLKVGGVAVRVESPGYAAPSWADIDGDGRKDLLVGQFNQGKIRVYKNLGDGKLAKGEWLKAEGAVAEVPGVW
jgi:FG-GAP-like repeat